MIAGNILWLWGEWSWWQIRHMKETSDEGIAEEWIQSTDQAMPEAQATSGLFSYMSNKYSLFVKPVYFPHAPICMFSSRVVACEDMS